MMVALPARASGSATAAAISGRTLRASIDKPASLYSLSASASSRRASASASPLARIASGLGQADLPTHGGLGLGVGEPLGLGRHGRLLAALAVGRGLALDPELGRVGQPFGLVLAWRRRCSRIVALSSSFWRSTSCSAIRMFWTLSSISPAFTAWALATSTSGGSSATLRLRRLVRVGDLGVDRELSSAPFAGAPLLLDRGGAVGGRGGDCGPPSAPPGSWAGRGR